MKAANLIAGLVVAYHCLWSLFQVTLINDIGSKHSYTQGACSPA
jgi:hypothetical protein